MFKKITALLSGKRKEPEENGVNPIFVENYKNIINELTFCVPENWSTMEIHFEYFPWKGDFMEVQKSKCIVKGKKVEFTMSIDVNDALIELNKEMEKINNDSWSSCHLELNNDGKYNFQFGYDEIPPLSKEMLRLAGDLN